MADPRNFLVDSDYPMDKIIGSKSGSFTRTTATYLTGEVVAHGFSFAPTYILQWSTSSTFIPCYSEQLSGDGFSPLIEAQTDTTNIYLTGFVPTGSVTFYYRVLLFMPSDINVDATSTAVSYNNFVINTDNNYPKIFLEGKITATTIITHNLGYYPLVDFWIHRISDGRIRHFPVSQTIIGSEGGAIVTTTTATFYLPTGHDYIYYKIYGDQN